MRQFHKAGFALLAGLAGLGCGHAALAQSSPPSEPQAPAAEPQGGQQNKPQAQEGGQKAMGAGIAEQGACGDKGQKCDKGFTLAPLDTTQGVGATHEGYGAGIGPGGEVAEPGKPGAAAPAPVPQYWLADASLFAANAGNAAQTLANEQALGVQAPSVLGNQAQFLLAATDRAISSLASLQANAEVSHPGAVPEIRAAMDQLVAAKGQAQQALDAANAGSFGPAQQNRIRSAYDHLQTAERNMAAAGRAYNAQGFVLASVCNFRGRGMGVGIGKPAPKAPEKAAPEKAAPEKTPEKAPEKAAPEKAPEPAP